MNDLKTLRHMVLGIDSQLRHVMEGAPEEYDAKRWPDVTHTMTVEADGYCGFYTVFGFNKDGKLIRMGAWE